MRQRKRACESEGCRQCDCRKFHEISFLLFFTRDKRAISLIVPLNFLKRDGTRQAVHISQSLLQQSSSIACHPTVTLLDSGSQLFHQRDDQEPAQPVGSILLPTRAIPRVSCGTINNGDTNRLSEPSIHHHLTQRRLRRVRERSPFIGGLLCLSRYMRAQAPSPTMTCGRYKRLRYTISVRVGITPSAREA